MQWDFDTVEVFVAEVIAFVPTVRIMKHYAPPVEALHCCLVRNKQYRFLVRGIRTIRLADMSCRVVGPITNVRYGLNSLKMQAAIFPIFSLLFNISLITPSLVIIAILATLGFASLGTLFSAISVNTRSREILLPVLFFPMVLPIVIGAVGATALILGSTNGTGIVQWIALLGAFATMSITISALLFSFTLGD